MNSNDPANDVYEYETEILNTRGDLFWELVKDLERKLKNK